MARIHNDLLKLTGSLGGFTFTQDEHGTVAKQKNPEKKKSEMNQVEHENMMEMGGASTAARELRRAITLGLNDICDRYFSGRLSGAMRRVVVLGEGPRGKRNLDIRKNGAPLEGFEFIKSRPLVYSVGGIKEKPTLNAGRNEVYWTSPTLDRKEQITAPEGATHFKFVLGGAGVCNYNYDPQRNEYLASLKPPSLAGKFDYSEVISLEQKTIAPVSLQLTLSDKTLPEEMGVVTAVGVEFYRNVNGELLGMEKSGAMRVLGVF